MGCQNRADGLGIVAAAKPEPEPEPEPNVPVVQRAGVIEKGGKPERKLSFRRVVMAGWVKRGTGAGAGLVACLLALVRSGQVRSGLAQVVRGGWRVLLQRACVTQGPLVRAKQGQVKRTGRWEKSPAKQEQQSTGMVRHGTDLPAVLSSQELPFPIP
ncbi:hypothetical protein S7711_11179 [Stachybotrys chartarum IBT 7711]|uniref:Uncharacterized protein n=1 Tax=Stachybotrys chartarum (strain CBS 109288 / IBT 7711) TaxID=1280523 RepID=A0A084AWG1_STACB|nr:hypothetical protein S7711_11179 [Stachybotrys chartarum IBT 7711]